jgi:hypothetical protein
METESAMRLGFAGEAHVLALALPERLRNRTGGLTANDRLLIGQEDRQPYESRHCQHHGTEPKSRGNRKSG